MDNRRSGKRLSFSFESDGFTAHGTKIPDIPVVTLAIRVGKKIARGPAIVDTGFDGGVFPNLTIVKLLAGIRPQMSVEFENPLYGKINTELYSADGYLYNNGTYYDIGKVNIFVPTEPEFLSEEVIIGREILNKFDITLSPCNKLVSISY